MNMKRKIIFFFLLSGIALVATAQNENVKVFTPPSEGVLSGAKDTCSPQKSVIADLPSRESAVVLKELAWELYDLFGNSACEGGISGKSIRKQDFESSWAGLEFGYLNFADFASTYKDDYKLSGGWRFSWNIVDIEVPFSSRCGLVTGVGYQSDVFFASDGANFSKRIFIDKTTGEMDSLMFSDAESSKLVARYITLPLLFEFQTSDKAFRFAAGAVVGWNFYSRLKNKRFGKYGEEIVEYKNSDRFTMNDFKAEATLRLAYRCWQLYFNMALTPLFDTCIHDRIFPYGIGINISF